MQIVNNRLEFDEPRELKKITGTRLPALFGYSPNMTATASFLDMAELYKEPVAFNKAIKYGVEHEQELINYFESMFKTKVNTFNDVRDLYTNVHFGGRPDGVTVDGDILEIKTTSKEEMIDGNVAHYSYFLQTLLYAYLEHINDLTNKKERNIYILIKFRDTDILPIIDSYTITFGDFKQIKSNLFGIDEIEKEVIKYLKALDKARMKNHNVKVDLELFSLLGILRTAYQCTSPKLDIKDKAFVNFTKKQIDLDKELHELVDELREVTEIINKTNEQVDEFKTKEKELKDQLKEKMATHFNDIVNKVFIEDEIGKIELRRSFKETIDTKKIKILLNKDQLKEVTNTSEVLTLRIS